MGAKTAEIVSIDEAAARRITERIKLNLEQMAEAYEKVVPLISEAFKTQAWVAMGYRRNGSARWIEDHFADALARLSGGTRKELTARLVEDVPDISTRGIAALTGVDQSTVVADSKPDGNPSVSTPPKTHDPDERPPEQVQAHNEADLANAFTELVQRTFTRKNVKTLSPRAREVLASILERAIAELRRED